jgi:ribosome-binding factor A
MSKRTRQVAETIQRVLGEVIQSELKDPQVDGLITSVVGVEVSADLQHARVRISVMGDDQQRADTMRGLQRARGFLRRRVGEELNHLRFIPNLRLELDTSIEQSMHIAELLRELQREREAHEAGNEHDTSEGAQEP